MKQEGILTDLDLSVIQQMVANVNSLARNTDHPHEILSVLLVHITSVLYAGLEGTDGHHKADILKLIDEFENGNIGTFEDLLLEIGRELVAVKNLREGETFMSPDRIINKETIEKEYEDVQKDT